jgi:glycosyltransferase involved in cell wall biosynthesis
MSARRFTVAMVAGMPFPMAKASVIRVTHIVNALVNRYDNVRVRVFAYRGGEPDPVHPHVSLHLVSGFDRGKARYYSWRNKLGADWKLIRELLRQRHEIDVIHCHTIEGLFIALSFKMLARSAIPVCIDVHGPIVAEMVHYRLIPDWKPVVVCVAALERIMLRSVRQVFVSNEGLGELMAPQLGADMVKVVFDYVSLELFAPERVDMARVGAIRNQFLQPGDRLVTYVGMFKDYQGVDYLLRAFAILARRHPNVKLALVGDGPCKAQYEALIREHDLASRIILPGLIPHSEVPNWLAVSDILVSPRIDNPITRAGFVSQMPEYMAMAKPIVATWVSGCRYLLRDEAGILVDPNDVAALQRGLEQALELSPADRGRLVANSRRNVEQFTWHRGIAAVYDTYCQLLSARETCT